MLSRRIPAATLGFLLLGALAAARTDAAVGLLESHASLAPAQVGARTVEGRVARLSYRSASGYPVTDVFLEPSGESFTILGGLRDGVFWVAEEEPSFAIGDRVELEVVLGSLGWRPRDAGNDAEPLPSWNRGQGHRQPGLVPRVQRITPSSVPAVADAEIVVEIEGENFGFRQGRGAVLFQGFFDHVPAEILSWSDSRIRCLVPKPGLYNVPQVLSGAVKVWTPLGGWSDGLEWDGRRLQIPFQYAGDRYTDAQLPIPVALNPSGFPWSSEAVRGVLERAINTWNEIPESYGRFRFEGETESVGERARDGRNVISWTDPWPHPASWLAVTWSAFDPNTGERLESDVEINAAVPWSITDEPVANHYDLRTVLTHELGHWLRLGHVQYPKSVMNAFIVRSETAWQLGAGDRMGAAWIYPAYGAVSVPPQQLALDAAEPVRVQVRVTDRLGIARAGLAPDLVFAVAEWEPADGSGAGLERGRGLGPFFALRATDGEGRTEILVPAPARPGRARIVVTADGTTLHERPTVVFGSALASRPAPVVRLLGPNPRWGTALRAAIWLPAPAARSSARILDARGRLVLERELGALAAGETEIQLDLAASSGFISGVYFLEIANDSGRQVVKFVYLQ